VKAGAQRQETNGSSNDWSGLRILACCPMSRWTYTNFVVPSVEWIDGKMDVFAEVGLSLSLVLEKRFRRLPSGPTPRTATHPTISPRRRKGRRWAMAAAADGPLTLFKSNQAQFRPNNTSRMG
jgi:hypothetical protein